MKVDFRCLNCNNLFSSELDDPVCPRCSSKRYLKLSKPQHSAERKFYTSTGVVYGDTKGAWKSFHSNQQKQCPDCGGTEFDFNWKRKERTCRKCGNVFSLPRRSA